MWGLSETRADVPVNGRHQELDFTAAQVQTIAAASYAKRIEAFRREGKLDRDARLFERVRRISGRLVAQAVLLKPEAAHWGWEVHVADSSDFDAFCMAGGKILVSERFLEAQHLSDGELAALLAHEISHALAEHVREQLTAVRRLNPAYAHLSPEDVASLMGWDLSVSFKLAELSRLQELEADDIGIYLAAKSGFNPRALVRFYRKLNRATHGPFLIDTHGTPDARMRAVENFAAYAELVYRESAATVHAPSFAIQ
jgi:predicted Zn-dependent protease